VLHDIGKFRKGTKARENGIVSDFDDHEKKSQKIIENEFEKFIACPFKPTQKQKEYIAQCAGSHYALGKLQHEAKKHKIGYSLKYIESPQFKNDVQSILKEFQNLKVEIGLLFLADSLAKIDSSITHMCYLSNSYPECKLNRALEQRPINIAAAKRYFEIILNCPCMQS